MQGLCPAALEIVGMHSRPGSTLLQSVTNVFAKLQGTHDTDGGIVVEVVVLVCVEVVETVVVVLELDELELVVVLVVDDVLLVLL